MKLTSHGHGHGPFPIPGGLWHAGSRVLARGLRDCVTATGGRARRWPRPRRRMEAPTALPSACTFGRTGDFSDALQIRTGFPN